MRFLETPPEGAGGDLLDGIDMKLLYRCARRTAHLCAVQQGQGAEPTHQARICAVQHESQTRSKSGQELWMLAQTMGS